MQYKVLYDYALPADGWSRTDRFDMEAPSTLSDEELKATAKKTLTPTVLKFLTNIEISPARTEEEIREDNINYRRSMGMLRMKDIRAHLREGNISWEDVLNELLHRDEARAKIKHKKEEV